ncbi:MAG: hypothetical protein EHM35_00535 [Planctomycetaceae bacterium]|nr:MAG: hypothetical protein EHM35_00535 [Planctomycetaceae bacterium]
MKNWNFRIRGRYVTVRFTVFRERYSLTKSGRWPLGGKLYHYRHYNETHAGAFFHVGPFADVRLAVVAY